VIIGTKVEKLFVENIYQFWDLELVYLRDQIIIKASRKDAKIKTKTPGNFAPLLLSVLA